YLLARRAHETSVWAAARCRDATYGDPGDIGRSDAHRPTANSCAPNHAVRGTTVWVTRRLAPQSVTARRRHQQGPERRARYRQTGPSAPELPASLDRRIRPQTRG